MIKGHDNFYDTSKWHKLRQKILKRDKYIDQVQKRYSLTPKEANIVHHIFPKSVYPEYALKEWNLTSVSDKTHKSLHSFNKEELSQKGFELLRQTARLNNIDIRQDIERIKKVYPNYKV